MLPIASNKLIYYNHTLDLIRAFCLHNALVVALGQLTNHYFLSVSWLSRHAQVTKNLSKVVV